MSMFSGPQNIKRNRHMAVSPAPQNAGTLKNQLRFWKCNMDQFPSNPGEKTLAWQYCPQWQQMPR